MSYESKTLPSGILIIKEERHKYKAYYWYIKGTSILHNEGEPAVGRINGTKWWYQYNKYHRSDGPAIEYANGSKSYYINGISYEEEDYWKLPDVKEFLYLKEHPELQAFT